MEMQLDIRRATATLRKQQMQLAENRRKYAEGMEPIGALFVLYRGWAAERLHPLRHLWVQREKEIRQELGPAAETVIELVKVAAMDLDRLDPQLLERQVRNACNFLGADTQAAAA
ncbi:hypothetical protein JN531_016755 (plasmid) [Flagellatimonas centrodinii]|uniref:hypothetical protein n=1 Tax=Flagellatimonas centrodinii TaxID=2806210 RepID=UPI001FEF9003|nr:hypothetical protein [Flagellatimonas centrodinii]ULQ48428.1 hypothetical protein JN531_016755 [Flagellatimonas centrodinii]